MRAWKSIKMKITIRDNNVDLGILYYALITLLDYIVTE